MNEIIQFCKTEFDSFCSNITMTVFKRENSKLSYIKKGID